MFFFEYFFSRKYFVKICRTNFFLLNQELLFAILHLKRFFVYIVLCKNWPRPWPLAHSDPEDHDFTKFKSTLLKDAITQVTAFLANLFYVVIFLWIYQTNLLFSRRYFYLNLANSQPVFIISLLKRVWPFILTTSLYLMMLTGKYDWNRPGGSGEELKMLKVYRQRDKWTYRQIFGQTDRQT